MLENVLVAVASCLDCSLYAMPEPWPAKTKMIIEKNSAKAALMAAGLLASLGDPIAIL